MSVLSFFSDQPLSMNHPANQSSSSGCDGFSPCRPKLSVVATSPRPKCQRHTRFTITRAVSGFFSSAIHFDSASRPLALPANGLPSDNTCGKRLGCVDLAGVLWSPRTKIGNSVALPSVTPIAETNGGGLSSNRFNASRSFASSSFVAFGYFSSGFAGSLSAFNETSSCALAFSVNAETTFFCATTNAVCFSRNCFSAGVAMGFSCHLAIVFRLSIVLVLLKMPASA